MDREFLPGQHFFIFFYIVYFVIYLFIIIINIKSNSYFPHVVVTDGSLTCTCLERKSPFHSTSSCEVILMMTEFAHPEVTGH